MVYCTHTPSLTPMGIFFSKLSRKSAGSLCIFFLRAFPLIGYYTERTRARLPVFTHKTARPCESEGCLFFLFFSSEQQNFCFRNKTHIIIVIKDYFFQARIFFFSPSPCFEFSRVFPRWRKKKKKKHCRTFPLSFCGQKKCVCLFAQKSKIFCDSSLCDRPPS